MRVREPGGHVLAPQELGDLVAVGRREDAADDGDAERAADLARRVVDRRAHTRLRRAAASP